ncbi:Fc.00g085550.m01.CDS01 [Cosmosporella sp. VM-42]
MSILFSYLRFAPEKSMFRLLIWNMNALLMLIMTAFAVALWTQCMPAHAYWDDVPSAKNEPASPHCMPEGPPILSLAIINAITDFLVCVLPIPTLWSLNLSKNRRIGLVLLFFLGFFVTFAGAWRVKWAHHVTDKTWDVTWEGVTMWIWTAIEADVGIICGCIPPITCLFGDTGKGIWRRRDSQEEVPGGRSKAGLPWIKRWKPVLRGTTKPTPSHQRQGSFLSSDGDPSDGTHNDKDIEMEDLGFSGIL